MNNTTRHAVPLILSFALLAPGCSDSAKTESTAKTGNAESESGDPGEQAGMPGGPGGPGGFPGGPGGFGGGRGGFGRNRGPDNRPKRPQRPAWDEGIEAPAETVD